MSGNKKSKTAEKAQEIDKSAGDPVAKTQQTEKRGPGRPPGSPNRDYMFGMSVKPRCPYCEETDLDPLIRVPRTTRRTKPGKAPDGKTYNQVYTARTKCRSCNKFGSILMHEFISDASEEAGYEEPIGDDADEGDQPGETSDRDPEITIDPGIDVLDSILAEENGT